MSEPDVRVGQIWADNDPRCRGRRTVRVAEVGETAAVVEAVTDWDGNKSTAPRRTSIRLNRFRPTSTGYRLIQDVPGGDES